MRTHFGNSVENHLGIVRTSIREYGSYFQNPTDEVQTKEAEIGLMRCKFRNF